MWGGGGVTSLIIYLEILYWMGLIYLYIFPFICFYCKNTHIGRQIGSIMIPLVEDPWHIHWFNMQPLYRSSCILHFKSYVDVVLI